MSRQADGASIAVDLPRAAFWAALAAGVAVSVPVHLPESGPRVNLSLFDVIVPGLFAWALVSGRIAWPSRRSLYGVAGILALVLAHSIFIYETKSEVSLPWLLRDTAKLCVIITLFALLCGLFRDKMLQKPASGILAGALAIQIPLAIVLSLYEPIYTPRTVFAATTVGLFLLLLLESGWHRDGAVALRALVASGVMVLIVFVFYSKSMAFAALCIFLWIAALTWTRASPATRRATAVGAVLLLGLWVGLHLWLPGLHMLEYVQPVSLERSLGIRVLLWSHAWEQLSASFPLGIGLGQYATTVKAVPRLAAEGHAFAHNTFLGLATELGMLGVVLNFAILAIIVRAGIGWGWRLFVPYVAFLAPLLLLHDAQGVRIVLVVLAIGVMHAGSRAAIGAASRSSL